jgi:hypothetical protein
VSRLFHTLPCIYVPAVVLLIMLAHAWCFKTILMFQIWLDGQRYRSKSQNYTDVSKLIRWSKIVTFHLKHYFDLWNKRTDRVRMLAYLVVRYSVLSFYTN